VRKRLIRFCELSSGDRVLLIRALLVVTVARIALWIGPVAIARRAAATAAIGRRTHAVEDLTRAITVVSRYVPKATCLTQALAVQALLTRCGHRSHVEIGVAKHSRFEAHAWVMCNGKVVLGASEPGRFRLIAAWE
jgi:hypothetical protein